MFLSEASIKRPIAMGCLIIALGLLGVNAYRKMGLELMPRIDMPYITIVTIYPGASPEEIETDIAKPIEDKMVTIEGLKHVTSACMENVSQILLEFNLDVDVDIAATDVREKLDLIRSDFPAGVEDPQIMKYDVNAKPIIQLALTGEVPLDELYDYADNQLRDRITVISGVADVQLVGGAEREVQVLLDRDKLASRGLTSMDVVYRIQQGIRTIPAGRVRGHGTEFTVKFDADFDQVADIGFLEVANQDGRRCYLRDIGRVIMGTEELRQKAAVDGRPCIAIKVVKKSDANAVKVVSRVREAMDNLQRTLPGGMQLIWVTDDGTFTQATVDSAWVNVAQGILLTGLILFLFLYNLRSLLVIAITMPLTIIIGIFFMHLAGFTLNTSTLLAMGMSVGILVTNSIVVLEAIIKRLDATGDVKASARLGSAEAVIAVLASAATNIVVLFPMAMMDGLVGLFIESFAMTMVIMTAISLFISFTLTPLLCSVLLKPGGGDSNALLGRIERRWNRMLDSTVAGYRQLLQFSDRHRWAAVGLILVISSLVLHALTLSATLGSSMANDPDRAEIFVKLEFPTNYSIDHTAKRVLDAENLLRGLPNLRHVLSTIGKVEGTIGQSTEGVYLAQILLRFNERTERDHTIDGLLAEARHRLSGYPDCIVTVSKPSFMGGQESDIEMEIAGERLDVLDRLALKSRGLSEPISGIVDVDTTVRMGKPELRIHPRRALLADLNSPVSGIGMALRANLEGLESGRFKRGDRNYDIVVKLEEEEGKHQIQNLMFPGTPGHPLVLTGLGKVEQTLSPVQITRKDKQRISKLFANLKGGQSLGQAVHEISNSLDEKRILPAGYGYAFTGTYERMKEGQAGLAEAAIIAIVLVILSLAAILESFRQPVMILVTLPLALVGMLWALYAAGKSLEIFVIMGGVMLIGIVVNNAILIMDRFNELVKKGARKHQAMADAACQRFRPIAMITLAAVLGMLPLAFGQGIGAELRNACGIASAGGILVSGVLTLILMPVSYNLFTRDN